MLIANLRRYTHEKIDITLQKWAFRLYIVDCKNSERRILVYDGTDNK